MYRQQEFENSLNNLGIIGQARRIWLSVFRKDPRRATRGIFNKIVDVVGVPEIKEEEEDKTSWHYICKVNKGRWGDIMYDFDEIEKERRTEWV